MAQSKRRSRAKIVVADAGDSECFSDLRFKSGEAFATFRRDGSSYSYQMSRAEFREWAASDLGRYFNANIR